MVLAIDAPEWVEISGTEPGHLEEELAEWSPLASVVDSHRCAAL